MSPIFPLQRPCELENRHHTNPTRKKHRRKKRKEKDKPGNRQDNTSESRAVKNEMTRKKTLGEERDRERERGRREALSVGAAAEAPVAEETEIGPSCSDPAGRLQSFSSQNKRSI
jgi:hypothetical protein